MRMNGDSAEEQEELPDGELRPGRSPLRIVVVMVKKDCRRVCPGSVSRRAGKQREQSRVLTENRGRRL